MQKPNIQQDKEPKKCLDVAYSTHSSDIFKNIIDVNLSYSENIWEE